jgi:hypothetical protein
MVLIIHGYKIKLMGDASTIGVVFIDADGEAIPVVSAAISHNTDREIDLVIPNLESGTYQVRVTTHYSGKALLKQARSYTFPTPLTVGSALTVGSGS